MDATQFPWFGIRTRSNQEKQTAEILGNKGYEPYLPLYRKQRRWSDRLVEIEKPLYPGYLFCRFDPARRLPIMTTPTILSIVGFGSQPAPIPDLDIDAVRAVLLSGFDTEPCSFLREGQRVRVKRGCLAGLEGILTKKKSQCRIVLSIAMLQRSISVEIDRESLAPV